MKVISNFKKSNCVLLLDTSNIVHRCFYGYPSILRKGVEVNHIYGFLKQFLKILNIQYLRSYDKISVFFVVEGNNNWRNDVYKDYKGNREYNPVKNKMINDVKKIIRCIPNTYIAWSDNDEADDTIAFLVKKFNSKNIDTIIFSADRDMWQLYSDNSLIYDFNFKNFISIKDIKNKFKIDIPSNISMYKALFGDKSDNIFPPVPNLRKKNFIRVLNSYKVKNIKDFLSELKIYGLSKNDKKLFRHEKELIRNYKLTNLKGNLHSKFKKAKCKYKDVNKLNNFLYSFDLNVDMEKYSYFL